MNNNLGLHAFQTYLGQPGRMATGDGRVQPFLFSVFQEEDDITASRVPALSQLPQIHRRAVEVGGRILHIVANTVPVNGS